MEYDFCCNDLMEMTYGDCLDRITESEVKNPESIQGHSVHMGDEMRDVKLNEIYLYNEEYRQIRGRPFSFCPWCGAELR